MSKPNFIQLFKKLVSKIFLILFLGFLATPTTILLVDDSIDVSVFYNLSEEKEEKGSQKNIEIESLFDIIEGKDINFSVYSEQNNIHFFLKKYSKPHLSFTSPPPDFVNS